MNNILKVIIIILAVILVSTQVYSQVYSTAPSKATVTKFEDKGMYPGDREGDDVVLGDEQGNVFISWEE